MTIKKKLPFWAVMLILLGGLILACVLSTTLGRYPISLKELWGIAWSKLPFTNVEPFWTKTPGTAYPFVLHGGLLPFHCRCLLSGRVSKSHGCP